MPPVVKKESPKPRPKTTSIIDQITSIDEAGKDEGLRFSVYGKGKTGKTRFACTMPKPMLLMGTENGTKSVKGIKGVDYVMLRSSSDIEPLVEHAKAKYKSVAVDHAGGLQDMVLKEVLGLDELPIQRSWGMCKREDWSTCGIQTKEQLRRVLMLSESHGIHICIIAHERNFNDEGGASDMLFPTVGSALTPSVANWLNGACDYICQTYIKEEVTEKINGGIKISSPTGKKEYCLRVGPHPVFMTGFRLPPGRGQLPEYIPDPSFNKVQKLITG